MMPLKELIDTHFGGNQAAFARHMGANRQQVSKWLSGEWIYINDKLYSPQRDVHLNDHESQP